MFIYNARIQNTIDLKMESSFQYYVVINWKKSAYLVSLTTTTLHSTFDFQNASTPAQRPRGCESVLVTAPATDDSKHQNFLPASLTFWNNLCHYEYKRIIRVILNCERFSAVCRFAAIYVGFLKLWEFKFDFARKWRCNDFLLEDFRAKKV